MPIANSLTTPANELRAEPWKVGTNLLKLLYRKDPPLASLAFAGLNMHWLWKLQGLCLRWGTWMPRRMVHIRTRHLAPLQWGHQEVPAKFNFASDVLDHWADMEKVMGWRRGTELGTLAAFSNSPISLINTS